MLFRSGLTNWDPRPVSIDLSFLPEGKTYKATIMKDGVNCDRNAEDYSREVKNVNSATRIDIDMASGGGFAMRLDPLKD